MIPCRSTLSSEGKCLLLSIKWEGKCRRRSAPSATPRMSNLSRFGKWQPPACTLQNRRCPCLSVRSSPVCTNGQENRQSWVRERPWRRRGRL